MGSVGHAHGLGVFEKGHIAINIIIYLYLYKTPCWIFVSPRNCILSL